MPSHTKALDIELATPCLQAATRSPRLPEYPSFAIFIAADADAAIYRKFENLNARNLLHLQSELHELEGQLEELDARDFQERGSYDEESGRRFRRWHHYSRSNQGSATYHRELLKKIKTRIKQYRKCDISLGQMIETYHFSKIGIDTGASGLYA